MSRTRWMVGAAVALIAACGTAGPAVAFPCTPEEAEEFPDLCATPTPVDAPTPTPEPDPTPTPEPTRTPRPPDTPIDLPTPTPEPPPTVTPPPPTPTPPTELPDTGPGDATATLAAAGAALIVAGSALTRIRRT